MCGSRHHDADAVGTALLPAGDGRGADQKRRPLRMVPRKGHRGRGQRHRPARNGTQRTPRLQTRTRGEGHHGGDETVAQGLPPGAAPAYAVPRGRSQAVRGAEIHRPLCPGAVARRQNLPARDAPQRRVGAGLHRPPKAISQTQRSLSRVPTDSRRSPSARSACAPKPQPSSPRSWRRWPTPDNKTAGREAQPPRNPAPAARLQHCRIK